MTSFTKNLHDALLRKSGHDFWKIWESKFDYNTNDILQVDGTSNSAVIVENFKHFEKVCRPSSPVRNDKVKALFIKKRSIYNELLVGIDDVFSVELISDIVMKIKKVKLWVFATRSSSAYHYIVQAVQSVPCQWMCPW